MKTVLVKLGSMARRRSSGGDGHGTQSSCDSSTGRVSVVEAQVARLKASDDARKARETRLSSLKPFVIDNTLVECLSSGSETLEDKLRAFKLLSSTCGLRNIVLAAFVKDKTPDLEFLQALRFRGLIDEHCFAFSELFDANGSDLPGQDLPFGLAKMIQYGIQNAILECDLAAPYINWNKYSTSDFCALVESRCRWVAANLYAGRSARPAAWVHLRDFATAMQVAPARVLELVEYLGSLDPAIRPRGILVTEPDTGHFPFEAAPCVAAVRAVMDSVGWTASTSSSSPCGAGGATATSRPRSSCPGGPAAPGTEAAQASHQATTAPPAAAHGGLQLPPAAAPAAVEVVSAGGGGGGGQLLVHVTAGAGLAHAAVLECLAAGAGGVMASLCEEAEPTSSSSSSQAAVSSLLDLVNLSRCGNTHVAATYDLRRLRGAAAEVRGIMDRAAREAAAREAAAAAAEEEGQQLAAAGRATGPAAAARGNTSSVQTTQQQQEAPSRQPAAAETTRHRHPLILGHA